MINTIFQMTKLRLREGLSIYIYCAQAHTARKLGSWSLNLPELMSFFSQQ